MRLVAAADVDLEPFGEEGPPAVPAAVQRPIVVDLVRFLVDALRVEGGAAAANEELSETCWCQGHWLSICDRLSLLLYIPRLST